MSGGNTAMHRLNQRKRGKVLQFCTFYIEWEKVVVKCQEKCDIFHLPRWMCHDYWEASNRNPPFSIVWLVTAYSELDFIPGLCPCDRKVQKWIFASWRHPFWGPVILGHDLWQHQPRHSHRNSFREENIHSWNYHWWQNKETFRTLGNIRTKQGKTTLKRFINTNDR